MCQVEMITLKENYGPFIKGVEYPCVSEGYDWVRLRLRGTLYYVDKNLVGVPEEDDSQNDERDEIYLPHLYVEQDAWED